MTIATITIEREIRCTGKLCRMDCPGFDDERSVCRLFLGKGTCHSAPLVASDCDEVPDDEWTSDVRRCDMCLEKTGDKT